MFARHLIESASADGPELRLAVRLNWYRSVPFSCVEVLDLAVDGTPLPAAAISVHVRGRRLRPEDLGRLDDEWWPVLDALPVRGLLDAPLPPGPHVVAATVGTRIPYLVGPGEGAVVIVDRARAPVTA